MKAIFAFFALATAAACAEQSSEQDALMNAIERSVTMPAGAGKLDDYLRNYAIGPDGKVVAIYVTPHQPPAAGEDVGCDVMLEDLESRPCTAAEEAELVADDQASAVTQGAAGQSRWFEDYRELPTILDGGCDVITIIYDPHAKQVESAECNGEA
jgi:hypothetical protein